MRYLHLLAAVALLSSSALAADKPAPAPSGAYVSDPAHSSVTWKINHLGLSNYTARFTKMKAELAWNAEDPASSKVTVEIDPLSVRTDFPFPDKENFDQEIGTRADFLAGQPIRFVSTSVKVTGENRGEVAGDLTFRGETHPATLDVTFNGSMAEQPMEKVPKVGFSAVARFKRSEWGVAPKIKSLGDDITVIVETELLSPAKAAN
jgi:polyisoprenoid-binding protein YceI